MIVNEVIGQKPKIFKTLYFLKLPDRPVHFLHVKHYCVKYHSNCAQTSVLWVSSCQTISSMFCLYSFT